VNTASNAPPVGEGAGQVVAGPTNTTHQRYRRTNLLSLLSTEERRAFMQERLDQAAMFRQIAASKHGVPGPIERNVLGTEPSEVEFEQTATTQGIDIEEVKRREELARREALIEVREEVLRRSQETPPPVVTPPPAAPTVDQTAHLRAMAERDAEILRLKREKDAADEQRRDAKACEAAVRAEQDEQQRLEAVAAARRQREQEMAEETRQAQEAAHQAELARITGPEVEDPAPAAPEQRKPGWLRRNAVGVGGVSTGLAGLAAATAMWLSGGDPEVTPPDPIVIETEADTLAVLHGQGLAAPRTPLGSRVLEAFEMDPGLREDVMRRVENTLLTPPTSPSLDPVAAPMPSPTPLPPAGG